jgi:methylase of polypeptide subunit release factors
LNTKAPDRNLDAALKQLMTYALALDNPPLLVVCDTQIIQIHTHFTNAPSEVHTILLQDIGLPANLDKLRWLFTAPDKFHPQRTIAQITEEAAGKFADLAQSLNSRDHPPQKVAHFLNQCLFCLFAEDAGLLPVKMFERLLDKSQHESAKLSTRLAALFASMQKGGDFGADDIAWFNGGLFATVEVLPLIDSEIASLHAAAKLDWSDIEPSIFGTLFERGLDPKKRAQLGAHYTDQQSILRIINPVIVEPLTLEWQAAKRIISDNMALYEKGGKGSKNALPLAQGAFISYLERLKHFKVLDPACGSGNFLYLALRALKDLEHKANLEAEMLGLQRQISIEVSPANVLGIEINPYATELARVTVWIGEIQWMLKNGYPIRKNPILQSLNHIENRDALLQIPPNPPFAKGGTEGAAELTSPFVKGGTRGIPEADWPTVDVIVGNPPFLGGSKMRAELGDDYTEALRHCYQGRVPGGADLVTYWFEKSRAQIENGNCQRTGLVATQSIRKGANQQVLARIIVDNAHMLEDTGKHYDDPDLRYPSAHHLAQASGRSGGTSRGSSASDCGISNRAGNQRTSGHPTGESDLTVAHRSGRAQVDDGCAAGKRTLAGHQNLLLTPLCIFNAWSDEPWINDGAAVRVSLVCFGVSPRPLAGERLGERIVTLNGQYVDAIHADLTSGGGLNLTLAKPLQANAGVAFKGAEKNGAFDIPGVLARQWLKLPNPNGRPNSDVLRPWANGMDIVGRISDSWVIDFGSNTTEVDAAFYETPFQYLLENVKPDREKNNDPSRKKIGGVLAEQARICVAA